MPFKPSTLLLLTLLMPLPFIACNKNDNAKPSPTAGMGGVRKWRGHHFYTASGIHYSTSVNESYDFPDTSFALTIASDSTVLLGTQKYKFESSDTAIKVHYFGRAYYFYVYNSGSGIAYFYDRDSIVFCSGDVHGASDYWKREDIYHTF